MSFPTRSAVDTRLDSASTSQSINIGSPSNGDLVLILLVGETTGTPAASGNISSASGFTVEDERRNLTTSAFYATLWKVCDGTEGATVSLTFASAFAVAARAWKVSAGTFTGTPEAVSAAQTTSSPNPPAITPSWGNVDQMVIAFAATDRFLTWSGIPASYTNQAEFIVNNASVGTLRAYNIAAERDVSASPEDPGAFTASTSANVIVATIAIQGTASGGSAIAPISSGYHLRGMR